MTAKDVTYYHYGPTSHTYVRRRLSRLAGGVDYANQYLNRFTPPHTNTGRYEKIFAVGTKGWELLAEVQRVEKVDEWYLPYRVKKLSYAFLQHALLLSRTISFATFWSRQQEAYTLTESRLSYQLQRYPALTSITLRGKTVSVIPDAFLCFERADGTRYPLLFEADCGSISGKKFRQHIRNRLTYLQSPQYKKLANTEVGRVCYLTIGQAPQYKASRLAAMQRLTQEVLAELKMTDWASVFLFAAVDYPLLFQSHLFDQPEWYHPDSQTPVSLFAAETGNDEEKTHG